MQWSCILCRYREHSSHQPTLCDRCGALDSYAADIEEPVILPTATELLQRGKFHRLETGDVNLDNLLLGGIVAGSTVMLWGRGGSGKSRVALRWASFMGQSLVLSLEMADSLCAHSANSAGAIIENLDISELVIAPSVQHRTIILDSLSELPENEGKALAVRLKQWAKDTKGIVFLIVHMTKSGEYAGRNWIRHWPDYELRVSQAKKVQGARVSVLKSRYSPLDSVVVPLVKPRQESL